MKKIDRLILGAFVGPFILTLAVVVFILLIQLMVQYVDELVGKGLSYFVLLELMFYFSLHLVPLALPLAVLLSSLITFGNLGEHNELTAIKGAGISLIRTLMPVFILSILIAVFSFNFNNYIVPKANLKAYSLLWDIKQKSPSLSLKEGSFYNGLPGYSIKVNQKLGDGKSLKEIMIYNHTGGRGNKELILADSGRMYTIYNERYLVLELFKGKSYHDEVGTNTGEASTEKFVRNVFDKSQIVFSLSAFDMKKTDEKLFAGHKIMHGVNQLRKDVDSLYRWKSKNDSASKSNLESNYRYHQKKIIQVKANTNINPNPNINTNPNPLKSVIQTNNQNKTKLISQKNKTDSLKKASDVRIENPTQKQILNRAVAQARMIRDNVTKPRIAEVQRVKREINEYSVELYKKFTFAFACITMFLIGAPLGAIIKKGGLGVPLLLSIVFFISFYLLSIAGEKWVKESYIQITVGMCAANAILLCFGVFFLRQARNDSRLFEADFYYVWQDRLLQRFRKKELVQSK